MSEWIGGSVGQQPLSISHREQLKHFVLPCQGFESPMGCSHLSRRHSVHADIGCLGEVNFYVLSINDQAFRRRGRPPAIELAQETQSSDAAAIPLLSLLGHSNLPWLVAGLSAVSCINSLWMCLCGVHIRKAGLPIAPEPGLLLRGRGDGMTSFLSFPFL